MQKTARVLIAIQILGAFAASVFAVRKIETIQYSGPVLSIVGLAIAFSSFRRNRPVGLGFGLMAPTVSVFCFSLIFGAEWSPDAARVPICLILSEIAVLHIV
jgi:hypothetical protein